MLTFRFPIRAAVLAAFAPAALVQAAAPGAPQEMATVRVEDEATVGYAPGATSAATKLDLSPRETPQSLTVITRERLDDQNLTSLRDVLDATPGVYSYQYDTERVLFTARGFTVDNLLYDGVPAVVNFSTQSVDETLDTALYERIEVVRGATGLMTGAGSPAASVNLVRKHADSAEWAGDFEATGGSWNERRLAGDLSMPLNGSGRVRGRLVAVYEDTESYQALYDKGKRVLYGIVDADLGDTTRLSLGFDYQENDPSGNTWGSFPLFLGDGTPADWPRSVTTATDWSFWDRRTRTVFAELNHGFANGWAVRAVANRRRFDEDEALFYVYGFPDPVTGEGLDPYAYRSDAQVSETAVDLFASGPFQLFGREHQLVFGYNGSKLDSTANEYAAGDLEPVGNFFEWDGSYPEPDFAAEGEQITDIHVRTHALYAATRLALSERVKLIAGARFSTIDTDYYSLYDASGIPFDYDFDKTIPYAGLLVDISRDFTAFASYTGIFKPQNAKDSNARFLAPVDGESFELGLKGEHFDGRLNTAITIFETRQSNVAAPLTDPDTGAPVLLPDGTQVSTTIDGTKTRGVELEATGEIRRGWNVSLGVTRYELEDGEGEDVRTFVPRTLVRAFTAWNAPGGVAPLTLGGGLNWRSSSSTPVSSPDGGATIEQAAVLLVSAMARWQVSPAVSVQLNVENLLDKKYYVLDEYDNTYYGAPASLSLGLNVKF